jgi:hypothetical protein
MLWIEIRSHCSRSSMVSRPNTFHHGRRFSTGALRFVNHENV